MLGHTTKSIAKNASVLFGSQVLMWLLTMGFMVVMPRYLGVTGVGKLQFATSLWMIVGIVTAFGTDILLTKEIARQPEKTTALFGRVAILRVLLFSVGYGLTLVALRYFDYPADTIEIVAIVGLSTLLRQLITAAQAALQGLEKMEFLSIGEIVSNALYTVVGIGLLLGGWNIYAIATLMVIVAGVNLAIQLFYLHRFHPIRPNFQLGQSYALLRDGWPYLLSSFFLVAYMQVDILIISALVDEEAIGWYGAADRLFGTFLFIPSVYITAAFPVFARMFINNQSGLQRLIAKSFDMLFLVSVPIGLGITIIANPLVVLIFGEAFANSGPVLAVLGVVLILTYQNILIGHFLTSTDRQNAWTKVMAMATIATIPLDMLLVPWCESTFGNGAIGGALAFVVTELGMILAGLMLLPSGALTRTNLWTALRTLVAGLGMITIVWQFEHLFIGIQIFAGVIAYITFVYLLRIIPREDVKLFQSLLQSLINKFRGSAASIA
ncbi:MAG: flippase [Caldilineaceae bacterium]|nr:flippase [Caldilineaceae bacterium]